MAGMHRPLVLLAALGVLAVALAAPLQEGENIADEATVLVDMGASSGADGDACAKAYDKFKANVDKMAALKDAADKKAEKLEGEKRTADADAKRCKDDTKEITEKSVFKKEVNDKQIAQTVKTQVDAQKEKMKTSMEAEKKKVTEESKKAKEMQTTAAKDVKEWKSKYTNTKVEEKQKYERDLADYKKNMKSQMDTMVQVQIEAAVFKRVRDAVHAESLKWEKKMKESKQDHIDELAQTKKKLGMDLASLKESDKDKAKSAASVVPPEVANDLLNTKNKLNSAVKMAQKMMAGKNKCAADCKDKLSGLETRRAKLEMKEQDCRTRESDAINAKSTAEEKQKISEVKLADALTRITQLQKDLQTQKRDYATLQEQYKGKAQDFTSQTAQFTQCKRSFVEAKSKLNTVMAKLSAGEGALMAEIETLKSSRDNEISRNEVQKNTIRKCNMDVSKTKTDLTAQIVKLRECGQEVFNAKRDVDKYKSRYDTLEMAHRSTTEQYRNTHSKLELCSDRMKDARVKEQGCEEAMRRMKTYNADQVNEQKLQIARLQAEANTAKEQARKMTVAEGDKARADELAKAATQKAVADAVAEAQATGLAVKAQAQEAVDRAAKEAVRLANEQALAGAANANAK